jgi:hypothetical protein
MSYIVLKMSLCVVIHRDRELSSRVKLLQLGVRRMIRWNSDKLTAPPDECGQYRCHHSQKICYLSVVST